MLEMAGRRRLGLPGGAFGRERRLAGRRFAVWRQWRPRGGARHRLGPALQLGDPVGQHLQQAARRGEHERRFLVENLAVGVERRQHGVELGILPVGRVQDADRFRLGRPANPLGVGPRLGQDLVVLPIGLAANHLVFCHSGRAVAVGDFLPLALHPLEDGLLVARRQIEPRDPQVDDFDSEPIAKRFGLARALASFRRGLSRDSCSSGPVSFFAGPCSEFLTPSRWLSSTWPIAVVRIERTRLSRRASARSTLPSPR